MESSEDNISPISPTKRLQKTQSILSRIQADESSSDSPVLGRRQSCKQKETRYIRV